MQSVVAAAVVSVLALAAAAPAIAAELPEIKASAKSAVPACVTPGRLMTYLKGRNETLEVRFDTIAVEYMRHGEQLGLRWDYAFFQMIVETGALSFKNGNRSGDVKPAQNNFAGLGATGKGEAGESFPDVGTGVRAHLQHVQMYAGERVETPVAERTRKVQEWGVLTAWHKGFKRPITFADLATKWAPGSRGYIDAIDSVAARFFDDACKKPDPRPELVALARGKAPQPLADAADEKPGKISGTELARKAIADGKVEENTAMNGLGAGQMALAAGPAVKIINAPQNMVEAAAAFDPESAPPEASKVGPPEASKAGRAAETLQKVAALPPAAPPAKSKPTADKAPVEKAAAAAGAARALAPLAPAVPPAAGQKCRVWTASYGGQKAVIVRALVDNIVNFTVLDVNEGQELREADAFIAAYAKGGAVAGEYSNQGEALDKAFDLCPEG